MKKLLYLLPLLSLPFITTAQTKTLSARHVTVPFKSPAWLLKGNSGTNASINFLGTTDAQPLVFKVNNQSSGLLDFDSLQGNTAFGFRALQTNTSVYNTAIGYKALPLNTGGQYNAATGAFALYSNTTGLGNVANGASALYSNTFGSFNTAIGQDAMYTTTSGSNNIAIGNQTLLKNTFGSSNTAIGSLAMYWNTASDNTAIGADVLYDNTTGSSNVATGEFSLYINTTGSNNTAAGNGSLFQNSTGNNNTAIGNSALFMNTSGNNNTAIGYNANVASGGFTNATAIGYAAIVDSSNKVRLGNDLVHSIGGEVNFTNYASDDSKKNIKENVPGLQFITALRPVTYNLNIAGRSLNTQATNNQLNEKANNFLKSATSITIEGSKQIGDISFTGLIAQEVQNAARQANYNFSGVDKNGTTWGLRYSEFVMPLIKAVQELSKMNDDNNAKIDDLQKQINELKALVTQDAQARLTSEINSVATSADVALQQNLPNPFQQQTIIRYTLPSAYSNAQVIITNSNGKAVKTISLNSKGAGQITVDAGSFSAGNYFYSLWVDGKNMGTKQMTVTR